MFEGDFWPLQVLKVGFVQTITFSFVAFYSQKEKQNKSTRVKSKFRGTLNNSLPGFFVVTKAAGYLMLSK